MDLTGLKGLMRRHRWLVVAAGIALIAVVAAIRARRPARRSDLYPDVSAVRYRYTGSGSPAAGPDLATAIRLLEARVQGPSAPPLEMAELADLYFQRAQVTGLRRDHDTAESLARRSLAVLPSPNSALITLARLADARHDFHQAIELARVSMSQRRSTAALAVLASSHLALGELEEAGRAADAAIALRPGSSPYLMRALVMQAQGRDGQAAADFTRAAHLEDLGSAELSARIRALWARFLLRRGELAGAELLLRESLRIVPKFPLALGLQGELALRSGRLKEARRLFAEAFAGARHERYLIDEARALELGGDRAGGDRLRTQVEKMVRADLAAGGLGHRLDLVELLLDRARPADRAEAVALARQEVARRPGAEVRFQLARALAGSGRPEEALAQLRAVLATGARQAEFYDLAARLERAAGSEQRAALYDELADDLDPGDSGWRSLGPDPAAPHLSRR